MNPSNAVFGTEGDFTTSPEISQVFGEVRLNSAWLRRVVLSGTMSPLMIVS